MMVDTGWTASDERPVASFGEGSITMGMATTLDCLKAALRLDA